MPHSPVPFRSLQGRGRVEGWAGVHAEERKGAASAGRWAEADKAATRLATCVVLVVLRGRVRRRAGASPKVTSQVLPRSCPCLGPPPPLLPPSEPQSPCLLPNPHRHFSQCFELPKGAVGSPADRQRACDGGLGAAKENRESKAERSARRHPTEASAGRAPDSAPVPYIIP